MNDLNSYIVDGAGYCGSTQHTCDHLAKRLSEIAASLDPNSPPSEEWLAALIGGVDQQRDSLALRLDRLADDLKVLAAIFRSPQVDERNSPRIGWDAKHSLL